MGCAPKNSARFAGLKSISSVVACTSTAQDGIESVHPLHGPELRALRPLQGKSPYVFTTEAGTPVTTSWFLRMVQRTGKAAEVSHCLSQHRLLLQYHSLASSTVAWETLQKEFH